MDYVSRCRLNYLGVVVNNLLEDDPQNHPRFRPQTSCWELRNHTFRSTLGNIKDINTGSLAEGLVFFRGPRMCDVTYADPLIDDEDHLFEVAADMLLVVPVDGCVLGGEHPDLDKPYTVLLMESNEPGFIHLCLTDKTLERLQKDVMGEVQSLLKTNFARFLAYLTFGFEHKTSEEEKMFLLSSIRMKYLVSQLWQDAESTDFRAKIEHLTLFQHGNLSIPVSEIQELSDLSIIQLFRSPVAACYIDGVKEDSMARLDPSKVPHDLKDPIIYNLKVEFTPGFKVNDLPLMMYEWVQRSTLCGWPPRDVLHKCIKVGCHVVPKSSFQEAHDMLGLSKWRMSFGQIEIYLVQSFTENQKKCLLIAKLLMKTQFRQFASFCSYHLKTAVFWLLQKTPAAQWDEANLPRFLLLLIDDMIHYFTRGRLPNFFIPEQNLIEDIHRDTRLEIARAFLKARKRPFEFLKDSYNVYHANGYIVTNFDERFGSFVACHNLMVDNFEVDYETALPKMAKSTFLPGLVSKYYNCLLSRLTKRENIPHEYVLKIISDLVLEGLYPVVEDDTMQNDVHDAFIEEVADQADVAPEGDDHIHHALLRSSMVNIVWAKNTQDIVRKNEYLERVEFMANAYMSSGEDAKITLLQAMAWLLVGEEDLALPILEESVDLSVMEFLTLCPDTKGLLHTDLQCHVSRWYEFPLPIPGLATWVLFEYYYNPSTHDKDKEATESGKAAGAVGGEPDKGQANSKTPDKGRASCEAVVARLETNISRFLNQALTDSYEGMFLRLMITPLYFVIRHCYHLLDDAAAEARATTMLQRLHKTPDSNRMNVTPDLDAILKKYHKRGAIANDKDTQSGGQI